MNLSCAWSWSLFHSDRTLSKTGNVELLPRLYNSLVPSRVRTHKDNHNHNKKTMLSKRAVVGHIFNFFLKKVDEASITFLVLGISIVSMTYGYAAAQLR